MLRDSKELTVADIIGALKESELDTIMVAKGEELGLLDELSAGESVNTIILSDKTDYLALTIAKVLYSETPIEVESKEDLYEVAEEIRTSEKGDARLYAIEGIFRRWNNAGLNKDHAKNPWKSIRFIRYMKHIGYDYDTVDYVVFGKRKV